jgi:hypothetical protein
MGVSGRAAVVCEAGGMAQLIMVKESSSHASAWPSHWDPRRCLPLATTTGLFRATTVVSFARLSGAVGDKLPYYIGEDLPRKGRVSDEMIIEACFRWLARADLTLVGYQR